MCTEVPCASLQPLELSVNSQLVQPGSSNELLMHSWQGTSSGENALLQYRAGPLKKLEYATTMTMFVCLAQMPMLSSTCTS